MKKILIVISCFALSFIACKKKYDSVSHIVKATYPTISFTGSQFYSIEVNGAAPTIKATAYDSVLKEEAQLDYDPSVIDASTPGLYIVPITAKNSNGYVSSTVVYVAVTDISPDIDLSGTYLRDLNGEPVHISKLANGLYSTDDVGGAATLEITAYFAQLTNTKLDLPLQPTEVGGLDALDETVHMAPGDTSISWIVDNAYFGTAVRTFVKQ